MTPRVPERPLRVMFPASLLPGGAERQMLLLTARLPRDRFESSYVLLGGDTPLADEARSHGARVHVLGAPRRAGMPMPLFAARVGARVAGYVRLCRRERFDIVDAWLYLGYGLAAVTQPLARVPVMISGRRSLSGFKAGFGRVERTVDALARRASDAFVANSYAVAEDVARRERIPRDRIRVIHNGVELPEPLDEAARSAIRAGWGVPDDARVIGVVGTFKPGKGQDRIVRVMPGILASVPDARLVLLGDGPTRSAVSALASSLGIVGRVVDVGQVPDARPLYAAFDLAVSASDAEGLPNAVLEAAAAGTAVVATDAGGTREIVTDGETGILVPVGDDDALGREVARLLARPDERARLGAAARDHAATAFGVDRFVRETLELYERLAARAQARRPLPRRGEASG
jgi:glycosyltransferase involved in cell wall biosynthesis